MFPEERAALDTYFRISDKALAGCKVVAAGSDFFEIAQILMGTPVFLLSKMFPVWVQKIIWRLFLRDFAKYSGQSGLQVLESITKNKRLQSLLSALWIDTGARPGGFFVLAYSVVPCA